MLHKLSLIMALISAVALPATDALARGRAGGRGYGGHGYGGHVGRGVYGGRGVVRRGGYYGGRGYYGGGAITAAMAAITAADAWRVWVPIVGWAAGC